VRGHWRGSNLFDFSLRLESSYLRSILSHHLRHGASLLEHSSRLVDSLLYSLNNILFLLDSLLLCLLRNILLKKFLNHKNKQFRSYIVSERKVQHALQHLVNLFSLVNHEVLHEASHLMLKLSFIVFQDNTTIILKPFYEMLQGVIECGIRCLRYIRLDERINLLKLPLS
jgi:hypothetical protein